MKLVKIFVSLPKDAPNTGPYVVLYNAFGLREFSLDEAAEILMKKLNFSFTRAKSEIEDLWGEAMLDF